MPALHTVMLVGALRHTHGSRKDVYICKMRNGLQSEFAEAELREALQREADRHEEAVKNMHST